MAKKDKPGTAVIPWEKELAADAAKQSAAPAAGGERTFLSIKGAVLALGDQRIKDNKLDVLIIDFAYVNSYYDKPFNPKAPASPVCYALGREKSGLAPHKEAESPQNDNCATCPNNEFGSRGDGSQGKACKNAIRLTLISAGDLANIDKAQIAYLMVPPTSVKGFANYYKAEFCDELGNPVKPTWALATTISVVPDPKTQVRVEFDRAKGGDITDRAQYMALRTRVKTLGDDVLFPFPKNEDRVAPKAAAAPARKRKFV